MLCATKFCGSGHVEAAGANNRVSIPKLAPRSGAGKVKRCDVGKMPGRQDPYQLRSHKVSNEWLTKALQYAPNAPIAESCLPIETLLRTHIISQDIVASCGV